MRYRKYYLPLLLLVASVLFAFVSYQRGMHADLKGDYYIYWQAGKNFLAGQTIYTPGLVDGGFTYPPFAALLFSTFSWMPFHTSAFLYTFLINYGLWVVSLVLIRQIFQKLYPAENLNLPFILAIALSAGFYWHNYIWMNANLPVLCFTLLGIRCYLDKKFNLSYLFFLAGTFFKVTPALFLIFAAIKRGPKDWPKIALLALPFIFIPMLFRGWHTGLQDWADYYQAFVAPFSKGKVDENIISLGIPALLEKLNTGNAALGYSPLLHLTATGLKRLTLLIQVLIVGSITAKFVYDRYIHQQEEFSVADFCMIFLITLLVPGRVWGHHHVCTSFIYTYLFILVRNHKPLLIFTILLCLLTEFTIKDVIGQTLCDLLREYCYITLVMIYTSSIIVWQSYLSKTPKPVKGYSV
ncbi:DUF2029 domain-containing protein [Mucilaginibacter robiniae]|uniref:DUF2029 domain-containing protein n=1 Tax=Mucilaginibacter robiniae TaxID=2728022 RepID=A0A7L5E137_9SPHI|nr:glycosyltransferase family 87 protein [Mucilaginibacter robiniae]QJD97072.1 DUF2029 domain-containing protein [Mucilaginibacter robiniae]